MSLIRYMDFDLEIGPESNGYRVRVLTSPSGEGASGTFAPIDKGELGALLEDVVSSRDVVRVDEDRPDQGDRIDRTKRFGGGLFRVLFAGEVGGSLTGSLRESARRSLGLRLRLRVPPDLGDVPWEYLYHRELDRFLCLSVETPIVRYLETPEPVRVVKVEPPLRILVMISSPSDHPPLDVEGEYARLRHALEEPIGRGLVALDRLEEATMVALHDRLLDSECHVFHFIGHGGFDPDHQDGVLVLEKPDTTGELVPGDDLGTVLHDHRPLRLAVLNSCEGARGSSKDPFAGTAQGLIQQRVPAVIAMQFPISDEAAKTFAEQFYSTLARGYPVDAALGEARKVIYLGGNRLEWATPVLYMRTANGRIFDVAGEVPLEATAVEVDPLASPEDVARLQTTPMSITADGKVLHLDNPHGVALEAAAAGAVPVPRLRRPPLDLRPKDFPDLLGRDAEVQEVTSALLSDGGTATEPVEVFGPPGAGKTALIRNVAHHPAGQFPDGVVYSASPQPAPDLLRFFFQTFYETDRPLMPSEADLRRHLHDVKALVLLDDVALTRDELEMLTNVAPNCLFLLSSERRVLFEEGPAVAVHGLPEPAALKLLERRLGRALTADELPAAQGLIAELRGLPLLVVQAASRIVDDGVPIAQVSAEVKARPSGTAPTVSLTLSEPERQLLAVLAAARAPVGLELLIAATGLVDAEAVLESLKDRGMVRSASPRYSLAADLPAALLSEIEATAWQGRALEALTAWAEERSSSPYRVLEEVDALLGFLRWAEEQGRWAEVVRLGRAIERPLALAARWSRWELVLGGVLLAARAQRDPAQEAWALHQLGTRAVGLEQVAEGRNLLLEALETREAIGDRAGAEVTRQNLGFAGGAPTPSGGGGDEPGPTPPHPPRWWLRFLVVAVVVAAGAVAAVLLWPSSSSDVAGLSVDRDSLAFADQPLDTPSASQTVTLESTGGVPVDIGRVRIVPADSGFSEVDTCSGVRLEEGSRCTIQVVFTPLQEGERSARLVIGHSGEGERVEISLSGTGLPPDEPTTPPELVPGIEVETEGGLVFREAGERQTVTIVSTGTGPLEALALSIDPPELEGAQYDVVTETDLPCPDTLEPGASCRVDVVFLGTPEVDSAATLVIQSTAEPVLVPLAGVPAPTITPVEADDWVFDELEERWEAVSEVVNPGTAPFTVGEPFTEDAYDPNVFEVVEDDCDIVGIGGSCTITLTANGPCPTLTFFGELVIIDPTAGGRYAASLTYDQPNACVD